MASPARLVPGQDHSVGRGSVAHPYRPKAVAGHARTADDGRDRRPSRAPLPHPPGRDQRAMPIRAACARRSFIEARDSRACAFRIRKIRVSSGVSNALFSSFG